MQFAAGPVEATARAATVIIEFAVTNPMNTVLTGSCTITSR
jgi:hypothetical protein